MTDTWIAMDRVDLARVDADLRWLGSWARWLGVLVAVALVVAAPLNITDDYVLSLLTFAGIYAIGAVGLNILMGYAGELSIGHAFFISVGAYTAVVLGDKGGLPLPLWLLGCGVVGGLAGLLVAPLAMRIRGPYLIVVTLGLVFIGQYVFRNWTAVSGGPGGTAVRPPLSLGPLDFGQLELFGYAYSRGQGLTLLVWLTLAITLVLTSHLIRSRAGRATMAARDNPDAAEALGIDLFGIKAGAFVVSSAIAAVAGGLFAAQLQYLLPETFTLQMSIQYIAIIVVGGVARPFGPVLGAFLIGVLPQVADRFATGLPWIHESPTDPGFGMSVAEFTVFFYGFVIVAFLVVDPEGLAGLWAKARGRWSRPAARGPAPARVAAPQTGAVEAEGAA